MAVTKLWPVKVNLKHVIDYAANPEKTDASIKRTYTDEQYQALADVLTYAKNEEKTEREFYVEGINCSPFTARDQFIDVKNQFNKTDGIQAYQDIYLLRNKILHLKWLRKLVWSLQEKYGETDFKLW